MNTQVASEVVMKIFKVSIILMLAVMVMAGAVSAAPARIASITEGIYGPFRVAVDASGNLYVTERLKNLVVIYSSEGKFLRSFSVADPKGIAVDATGTIYIGSLNSVNMYTPDLVFVKSLDNGDIVVPNDIAVGSDGKVYVVSKGDLSAPGLVKAYDPVAGSSFTFSGSFTKPNAIAVSDTAGVAGEIYVLDRPVIAAVVKNRIQVFNKSGQFLRSFEYMAGQTTLKPQDIAVDGAGLLYVVDSTTNGVFVLNPADGSPAVGTAFFFDPLFIMRTPLGIAISKNGLVYAASSASDDNKGNGRIDVFALDGYVTMAVDPLSLTFVGKQYTGNPDPLTIIISNTSGTNGGTLNWSAAADHSWITLDASQGSVGANSASGLPVRVNISSFGSGTYTGAITIDSGFGQKKTINVTVSVVPANILNISDGWLNFTAKAGTTPAAQSINIGVDNLTGPLDWRVISSDPSWLSIAPAAGTATPAAPSTQSWVSVNTTVLTAGSYTGLLTVSAPGAIGTDSKITVNLTVTPSSKLSVQTNLESARFTLSGPATYSGSGRTWSVDNAPAGQYTVTFDPVTGYKKPVPQTKTLIADGATTFTASYVSWQDLAARKHIIVAKGPDARNDSRLNVYKADGAPVAFDLVALEIMYGANVAIGDVNGDGAADLIVGAGQGADNPALVRVYNAGDKSLITSFTPFGSLGGVKVAAGDLNGDGQAEIIVSIPANGGELAVYTYDNGQMVPTGIALSGVVLSAVADTEGDGLPELVTVERNNIKIYKIDLAGGVGSWTATMAKKNYLVAASSLAAADVNGDGIDEIIAAKNGTGLVVVLFADGTRTNIRAFWTYNTSVAAADLDGDGSAEILAGRATAINGGTSDLQMGLVRIFSATGVLKYSIEPFGQIHDGVTIAVGDLGL